jgi:hypothetical protein
MSWMERLRRAQAAQNEDIVDPWRQLIERALPRDVTAVSTITLCDLVGVRPSTGNARRIACSMRALGFVPTKSRRFVPGGWRSSLGRGWARPIRDGGNRASRKHGEKIGTSHPDAPTPGAV